MAETITGCATAARGGRGAVLGLALVAGMLLAACGGMGAASPTARVRAWAEGPVRWMMLPAEERELRRLRSAAEGARFIEEFWRRRDPTPGEPGNPLRERFEERVAAADVAYADEAVRGSLTARGRALLLLGSPPLMRHGRRNAPAWRPARSTAGPMPVRLLVVETWEYGYADLPPALVALLEERDETRISLTFVLGEDGADLVDGEDYLELAAEATVQLVPDGAPEGGRGSP